jgi:hypothetical protein
MKTKSPIEKLQFPIGKFRKPDIISTKQITAWITTLENFPAKIKNRTTTLTVQQLNWKYRPNGWNIKQLVHHCADSHMNCFIRFKLALTEDNPTNKPYEEQLWAELTDGNSDEIFHSLQLIESIHYKWVLVIKSMDELALNKTFTHPAQSTTSCLAEVIGMYAWHCNHHFAQIELALEHQGQI